MSAWADYYWPLGTRSLPVPARYQRTGQLMAQTVRVTGTVIDILADCDVRTT